MEKFTNGSEDRSETPKPSNSPSLERRPRPNPWMPTSELVDDRRDAELLQTPERELENVEQ